MQRRFSICAPERPRKRRVVTYLPAEVYANILDLAADDGRTIAGYLRWTLRLHVEGKQAHLRDLRRRAWKEEV